MPFIQGRYYLNPSYGRAVERARARTLAGEQPELDAIDSPDGHWVTINHRHVFIGETRKRIASIARKYNGSTAWAFAKSKDNFGPNTNKCNEFVYDVTREAGARALVVGGDGKPRPPLAAEWADPRVAISGWRVLGPSEMPQPGDVAAYKLTGGGIYYSGHSSVVVSLDPDGTVHAIAAHNDKVGPDDKFNPTREHPATFRRYIGGE